MWFRIIVAAIQAVEVLAVAGVIWLFFNAVFGVIAMKIKSHNSDLKKIHKNDKTIICKLINRIGR